jgi:hypothetical protein
MNEIRPPNLDDRTFKQLLEQAMDHVRHACPTWTDRTPGDPGIVLLEAFSYLTEAMIYRLNRVPEKVYVQLLRLLGVHLIPPGAASVTLRFSPERGAEGAVLIPKGTRVTLGRPGSDRDAPVFVTTSEATLAPGAEHVDVRAMHCEVIEAEDVGETSGQPGQVVHAKRPPIVAPSGDGVDLIVGVEATEQEAAEAGTTTMGHEGKAYLVWREVASFAELTGDPRGVVTDRAQGRIDFPPAIVQRDGAGPATALGATPPPGRRIRLWYRRGGGASGNVVADSLTALRDQIPGVRVTNLEAASGGADAETLENALKRGPYEFRSANRAVTADDYERLSRQVPSVARARALTSASIWAHAAAGSVDVVLVPEVERRNGSSPSAEQLRASQTGGLRDRVQQVLDERRPLGTLCVVRWAKYKPVSVRARVVTFREVDASQVAAAVSRRLGAVINPLPSERGGGWPFGQELRVSSVYEAMLAEPGVRYVDKLVLLLDDAPDGHVVSLAGRSAHRPHPWFACVGDRIYLSTNDGDGWELSDVREGEEFVHVEFSEERPGLGAAFSRVAGAQAYRIYVTSDGGEKWQRVAETDFRINDLGWTRRDGEDVLLIAAQAGLYELTGDADAVPLKLEVASDKPDLGFVAVTPYSFPRGGGGVAAAARQLRGVFVSVDEGKSGTFAHFGLEEADVNVLKVQTDGPRRFLWAGMGAEPGETGRGCAMRELTTSVGSEQWDWISTGWNAGSCRCIAFGADTVFAGSHRGGVLRLSPMTKAGTWRSPELSCGLPLREADRLLHPIDALACDERGDVVISGGPMGLHRSDDGGETYALCSGRERTDRVTVPEDALLCSGEHRIQGVNEDEIRTQRT